MSKIFGYMVTWTTYGSWLPGDERGYVEKGRILPGNLSILQRNRKRQKASTVKLNEEEKQILHKTILSEAERIAHKIKALAVCTNHVHLIASPHSEPIDDTVGRYKSLTTRVLWDHGRKSRIWAKGYDKRFCFTEEKIAQRIRYVNKHNLD